MAEIILAKIEAIIIDDKLIVAKKRIIKAYAITSTPNEATEENKYLIKITSVA